jgi:hypothetical protein
LQPVPASANYPAGLLRKTAAKVTEQERQEFMRHMERMMGRLLITIQMVVPEPLGEEAEVRENDLVVPKGSAKVGDIVNILIKSEPAMG